MNGAPNPDRADPDHAGASSRSMFDSPEWYDRGINWDARLRREVPVLCEVFGPPAAGGVLDAGCGVGRQVIALAEKGYTVIGADLSQSMIDYAHRLAAKWGVRADFVLRAYADLPQHYANRMDGVFCIGNSLASAGSEHAAREAVASFAAVLRPGGRLFLQVLNFPLMRKDFPCVRGPRLAEVDGTEYVSARCFQFVDDASAGRNGRVDVTNITFWKHGTWQQFAGGGSIYPMDPEELLGWCGEAGLTVLATHGAYDRSAFDPDASVDFIVIAERGA